MADWQLKQWHANLRAYAAQRSEIENQRREVDNAWLVADDTWREHLETCSHRNEDGSSALLPHSVVGRECSICGSSPDL